MACCLRHMIKLAPFYMFLLLALWSCGWVYRVHPFFDSEYSYYGKSYIVRVSEKVTIYKEPSVRGEPLRLEKPEEFAPEEIVCSEGRFFCNIDLFFIKGEDVFFFKVRFESGEIGYIKYNDFEYDWPDYFQSDRADRSAPRHYKNVDFDSVWDAAIDTLNEQGYVIAIMRKEEGYIATQMKNSLWYWRNKLGIRLYRENDAVKVRVVIYAEKLSGYDDKKNPYWIETGTIGIPGQRILDEIGERLRVK